MRVESTSFAGSNQPHTSLLIANMPPQLSRTYTSVSCGNAEVTIPDGDVELGEASPPTKITACQPTLGSYLQSFQHTIELIVCFTFFLVTNVVPKSWIGLELEPFQRPIPHFRDDEDTYTRNLTNNEIFVSDTVPFEVLILLSGVLPFIVQLLLSCCGGISRILQLHRTACVYLTAWSLNMLAVDFVKNYVGYLRPVFYQYCEPNDDYSQCLSAAGGGSGIRRSFPSGHAATAFCGLTLLTLYLHGRFGVPSRVYYKQINTNDKEPRFVAEFVGVTAGARLVSVLSLIPMGVALWIAASRVRDNKHFPADIIAGSLIGSGIASFAHGLWFLSS